jgi:DNA-binding CsgD family transcriptional regulator/tetratricopeptide (TPR) repeat protein
LEKAFATQLNLLPDVARLAILASALDANASIEEVLAAATLLHDGGPVGLDALEGAIATGYIAVAGTGLRFTHPLMRSAVEQTAAPRQVLAMRAALARVVSDADRRLWHRALSSVGRDEEIAEALEGYARAARRRGAVMVAVGALERAADLSANPQKGAERLVRAAELSYELGLVETVRSLIRRAEPLDLGALESARLAWLQQMISGDVWVQTGATKTFVTIAQQMLDGGDPDMALRSLVPIAHRCWWTRARTRTRQYLVDTARNLPFPDTDPRLLAVLALAHPERTGPSVLRRVSRMQAHEFADPVAAMHLGIAAEKAGDFVTGARFLARATEQLRRQGRLGVLTQALVHYAWAATQIGEWEPAAAAGAEAARLAGDTRQPQFGLTGELIATLATALRGNEPDLEALLAKPERTLLGTNGGPLLAPAHIARGAAALGEGRHEEAFSDLWPIFDQNDPAFHRFMRWSVVLDLVEAGGHGDHADRVATVIAELEEIARRSEPPILRVGLTCARPLLAGDDQAEDLFATAVGRGSANYPFLRARTLFSFGCWLRRKRRSADSRTPLRDAVALFDAVGANRWSDRARHELRASGETIGRRTPDARDRLTAQELQIAQLAAQGLSNRQIGERLFLSHRTIGSHLYRIFPKLEITTRSQLRDALTVASHD